LIFKEFIQSYLEENLIKKFYIPDGINLIEINRKTGKRFNLIPGQTILEAFVK
jgi:membrane carboxypeptidase/penicillin-binding protein